MHAEDMARLSEEVAFFLRLSAPEPPDLQRDFRDAAQPDRKAPESQPDRQPPAMGRDDDLDMGM